METQEIVHRLLIARRRSQLSQQDLADLTNRSQPSISMIEKGIVTPRVSTVVAMAQALGFELELVRKDEEVSDDDGE
jgi:transcriptional regulator with XRE-family HTH domain